MGKTSSTVLPTCEPVKCTMARVARYTQKCNRGLNVMWVTMHSLIGFIVYRTGENTDILLQTKSNTNGCGAHRPPMGEHMMSFCSLNTVSNCLLNTCLSSHRLLQFLDLTEEVSLCSGGWLMQRLNNWSKWRE